MSQLQDMPGQEFFGKLRKKINESEISEFISDKTSREHTQELLGDVFSICVSEVDRAVQMTEERIVEDIEKIDFMDLFMNYKRNPIYTITDEIMWQIKEDIISLITNKSDINK